MSFRKLLLAASLLLLVGCQTDKESVSGKTEPSSTNQTSNVVETSDSTENKITTSSEESVVIDTSIESSSAIETTEEVSSKKSYQVLIQ